MVLHTVNKPAALSLCLPMLSDGDVVLLIEDGVTLGLSKLDPALADVRVLAMQADVDARGLTSRLPAAIETTDYHGFVNLAAGASKVCAWY